MANPSTKLNKNNNTNLQHERSNKLIEQIQKKEQHQLHYFLKSAVTIIAKIKKKSTHLLRQPLKVSKAQKSNFHLKNSETQL